MTRLISIFIVGMLALTSCTKMSDIHVHGARKISVSELSSEGISGTLTLDVTNRSSKVTFSDTEMELFLANSSTPFVTIRAEKIILPKGSEQEVLVPFNIRLSGGVLGAISIPSILKKQRDKVNITVRSKVKNGWVTKRIKLEHQPFDQFMKTMQIDPAIIGDFSF